MQAAGRGHGDVVRLLLDSATNVNAADEVAARTRPSRI